MSLLDKLKASGSIKSATILSESVLFNEKELTPVDIPILNVAYSGKLNGGIAPGLTVVAGPSKHFKSNIGLVSVKSYLNAHKDAICLFYDSEFGITPEYIAAHGIDADRVLHIPVEHVEQLKFDIAKRLESIVRGDKVFIFLDSLGNLASKKEVEDALDEKSVADMTRAKQIKSLFRIVTPHLTTKDIPMCVVNHTYEETGMFPKQIVSGGTGVYYSASTIWIVGRSQEKTADGIVGWNFNINIEKSRFVKEKSKLTFQVTYNGGINKWSGLLDLGIDLGFVVKPSNGWYAHKDSDKKYRLDATNSKEFWMPILTNVEFQEAVADKYQLGYRTLLNTDFDETEDVIAE
jgi:RecA/RadA recombinase